MKIIELKCPCGAEIKLEDPRQCYINRGGHTDLRGRVLAIQVTADKWIDAHKDHKKEVP
jgi:hypothetical protein